jgi:hypothetical protein
MKPVYWYEVMLEEVRLRMGGGDRRIKVRAQDFEELLVSAKDLHLLIRELQLELWALNLKGSSRSLQNKTPALLARIQEVMGPLEDLFSDVSYVEGSLMSSTGLGQSYASRATSTEHQTREVVISTEEILSDEPVTSGEG